MLFLIRKLVLSFICNLTHLQYWNTRIVDLYTIRKLQYSSSNNTGNTSIVKHTYWKLQYSSSNNTGNTSIVKHTLLETLVSGNLTPDIGRFWKILVISVLQILEY
jgi:hypothetical protein